MSIITKISKFRSENDFQDTLDEFDYLPYFSVAENNQQEPSVEKLPYSGIMYTVKMDGKFHKFIFMNNKVYHLKKHIEDCFYDESDFEDKNLMYHGIPNDYDELSNGILIKLGFTY